MWDSVYIIYFGFSVNNHVSVKTQEYFNFNLPSELLFIAWPHYSSKYKHLYSSILELKNYKHAIYLYYCILRGHLISKTFYNVLVMLRLYIIDYEVSWHSHGFMLDITTYMNHSVILIFVILWMEKWTSNMLRKQFITELHILKPGI